MLPDDVMRTYAKITRARSVLKISPPKAFVV